MQKSDKNWTKPMKKIFYNELTLSYLEFYPERNLF